MVASVRIERATPSLLRRLVLWARGMGLLLDSGFSRVRALLVVVYVNPWYNPDSRCMSILVQ